MNRRKAIGSIFLLAGAGAAAITGVKLRTLFRTPDLNKLQTHKNLITELAETIIPATDTPGAKAANVAPFIIGMIEDCTPKKEQNKFLNGLEDVEDYAYERYSRSFVNCSQKERNVIVDYFERRDRSYKGIAGKVSHKILGDPFFVILKKYTVMGYCNSMEGATKGMAYDFIPGRYEACVLLQPGQKCWATE